jgi:hypothetical protein
MAPHSLNFRHIHPGKSEKLSMLEKLEKLAWKYGERVTSNIFTPI